MYLSVPVSVSCVMIAHAVRCCAGAFCTFLLCALIIRPGYGQGLPPGATHALAERSDFVTRVFAQGDTAAYAAATEAFVDMLEQHSTTLTGAEQSLLRRHVARFAALLPRRVLAETLAPLNADGEVTKLTGALETNWHLLPGAGHKLASWWRAQDILPATVHNERLEEHLLRAAHADSAYAWRHSLTGWDDRGLIYVRLGAPARKQEVDFDSNCLVQAVLASTRIFSGDLARNEVWLYGTSEEPVHFVFSGLDGPYELSTPSELISGYLRRSGGRRDRATQGPVTATTPGPSGTLCGEWLGSGTGQQILALATRRLYHEMIPFDSRYVDAYMDVADFINAPPDAETPGAQLPPHLWMRSFLSRQEMDEQRTLLRREQIVPRQHSNVEQGLALPLVARTARFLADDGTTHTEIYWTLPVEALAQAELVASLFGEGPAGRHDRYVVNATLLRKDDSHRTLDAQRRRLIVRVPEEHIATAYLPVQRIGVEGSTKAFHLAAQWDVYPLRGEGAATTLATAAPVARAVFRTDRLRALDARADRLEMSDLVPIRASDALSFDATREDRSTITPLLTVPASADAPLALYFEAYHLTFGSDDRTHYTVAYEIARRETGGLLRFLKRDREERTAASAAYQGTARTARDVVVIDLEEWGEGDTLVVTVRVTDAVTGQTVERHLEFAPAGGTS